MALVSHSCCWAFLPAVGLGRGEQKVEEMRRDEDKGYEDTTRAHLMSILTMLGACLARPAPTAASTWVWSVGMLSANLTVFCISDLL